MTTNSILSGLPKQIRRLKVNIGGTPAGVLNRAAQCTFTYTKEDRDVSLTMPYRPEPYSHGALHPIFTQNLPEGYLRRYISEKLMRYANVDDMYLLALMGEKGSGTYPMMRVLRYRSRSPLPSMTYCTGLVKSAYFPSYSNGITSTEWHPVFNLRWWYLALPYYKKTLSLKHLMKNFPC
ncbi:HipA N-terminal domain-containing protein [Alteromonas sp. RKMC-009]|uniref:HipA N-terminal domain-containing protein n=1 Tax=Alteromonas sp. RKMC-009 TaxID=2267264 RepID=UPI001375F650